MSGTAPQRSNQAIGSIITLVDLLGNRPLDAEHTPSGGPAKDIRREQRTTLTVKALLGRESQVPKHDPVAHTRALETIAALTPAHSRLRQPAKAVVAFGSLAAAAAVLGQTTLGPFSSGDQDGGFPGEAFGPGLPGVLPGLFGSGLLGTLGLGGIAAEFAPAAFSIANNALNGQVANTAPGSTLPIGSRIAPGSSLSPGGTVGSVPPGSGGTTAPGGGMGTTPGSSGAAGGTVGAIGGSVGGTVGDLGGAVGGTVGNVGGTLGHTVGDLGQGLGDTVSGLGASVGGTLANTLGGGLGQGLGGTVGNVTGSLGGTVGNVAGSLGHDVGNLSGGLGNTVSNAAGGLGDTVTNSTAALGQGTQALAGAVGGTSGTLESITPSAVGPVANNIGSVGSIASGHGLTSSLGALTTTLTGNAHSPPAPTHTNAVGPPSAGSALSSLSAPITAAESGRISSTSTAQQGASRARASDSASSPPSAVTSSHGRVGPSSDNRSWGMASAPGGRGSHVRGSASLGTSSNTGHAERVTSHIESGGSQSDRGGRRAGAESGGAHHSEQGGGVGHSSVSHGG